MYIVLIRLQKEIVEGFIDKTEANVSSFRGCWITNT